MKNPLENICPEVPIGAAGLVAATAGVGSMIASNVVYAEGLANNVTADNLDATLQLTERLMNGGAISAALGTIITAAAAVRLIYR